jgi:diguanylate cyclase (GGDEF)-like protein
VRVTLANTQPRDRQLVLREAYPLMDHLALWSPQPDGRWRAIRTGDRLPFGSREFDHRDFLFTLDLPASTRQTYYLRFASSGPIDIALSLYEPHALVGALSEEQLAYGAYFGGFLVLVLYNFFIFLVVRDRAFFYYLLYAISYGLYFSVFNGLSFQFLWPDNPAWANMSLLVLLSCTLIFGLQFTRKFLDTGVHSPRLDRFAIVLQALAGLAFVLSFLLPYSKLIQPLALLTVLVTGTILTLGTIGLVKGYKPARYFMIAWGLLLLGVLMNLLKTFGVLPHNMLTQNGFQVGSLCEMVLLSLALASRVSEMQRMSRTDALTKLFNRRFFDERVAFEFERAQRYKTPVALLVADIDHFKEYNDTFGHTRGDDVLRTVAKQLLDGVRTQDIVCRYGGEEFALILPGTDGAQAAVLAESLRRTIESHGKNEARVTISVGVASPQDHALHSVDDLFRAADAALYQAKAQGRNRVVRFVAPAAAPAAA